MANENINGRCKQCSKDFIITPDEAEWFKSRNLDLPKRCPECRARNRQMREGKR